MAGDYITRAEFETHRTHRFAHSEARHEQAEGLTIRFGELDNALEALGKRVTVLERWQWRLSGWLAAIMAGGGLLAGVMLERALK